VDFFGYKKHKDKYINWLKKNAPSNYPVYPNKLDQILDEPINTPAELRHKLEPYIQKGDRHALNAVRNYLRFLIKTGIRTETEVNNFRAVIPTLKTKSKSETEKAISKEDVIKAYNSITGKDPYKRIRQLAFKLLTFTGLREKEVLALLQQFDPEIHEDSYKAFGIPKEIRKKVAVYDMERVEIPGRSEETKRTYVAIFPRELLDEILWFKRSGLEISKKTIEPKRMFKEDGKIKLKLLRSFHMNWLNDNAWKVKEKPADIDKIIEFIQGRAPKTVGGRNYRANVQAAVKFYSQIVDEFKKDVPILK